MAGKTACAPSQDRCLRCDVANLVPCSGATDCEHNWVREALASEMLFSVFQPIFDVVTGTAYGCEALIRSKSPGSDRIYGAGEIIQACDALGLQHVLDQEARKSAIRCASSLDLPDTRVFINFLPNTIYDPEICLRTTMHAAEEYGMPMDRLVFEVVETERIPEMEKLKSILDYYRSKGAKTAVDDMGAGFTSLDYLYNLQPDYVKLDRDLVVEAVHSDAMRHRMMMIINMAREMEIKIIAEGIETEAQMRLCIDSGADLLQGYRFARPEAQPRLLPLNPLG